MHFPNSTIETVIIDSAGKDERTFSWHNITKNIGIKITLLEM